LKQVADNFVAYFLRFTPSACLIGVAFKRNKNHSMQCKIHHFIETSATGK